MALYYITGISGSGKSTILQALKDRGYDAYDVDEAGPATAKWHNDVTGFIHPKSTIKAADRTPDFLAQHSWKVPRDEVIRLARQAGNGSVFLGGSIANEFELQDLFSTVFALAISDEILTHRLESRTNNDWGKSSHELEYTLSVNHDLDERYRKFGYTVIDASQPENVITDQIIQHVSHS